MIFLHFFFKNSQKNQFPTKESKNFVTKRRHVISSLKNKYKILHTYLNAKWQWIQCRAVRLKIKRL